MPGSLPAPRDVHVDTLLSDFAIAHGQDLAKAFLADQGTTVKTVRKTSDKYRIYDKGDMFRSEMQKRAPGTRSKGGGYRVSDDNYEAERYSLHTWASSEEIEDDDLQQTDSDKTRYLAHQAKMKRDKIVAETIFGTGLWTSNTEQTGVAAAPGSDQFLQFNDDASTPIKVIHDKVDVIRTSIGRDPNTLIIGSKVRRALRRHPDLIDLTKHTSEGLASMEAIAEAFEVERILVGRSTNNTAKEGQTATMADIWGNHMLLAYISPTANTEEPTAVTSFVHSKFDKITANDVAVKKWYERREDAWFYEADIFFDVKITSNDAGVFFLNAVAA